MADSGKNENLKALLNHLTLMVIFFLTPFPGKHACYPSGTPAFSDCTFLTTTHHHHISLSAASVSLSLLSVRHR